MKRVLRIGLTLWKAQEGNFLIEYALFLPVLLLILAIMFDLGMALYDSMSLKEAARAGAQYAMKNPSDTAGLTQVVSDATGISALNLTVTSSESCQCADGTGVNCGTSCADGSATETYVTVLAQEPYTPLLPYPESLAPLNLHGEATLRIH